VGQCPLFLSLSLLFGDATLAPLGLAPLAAQAPAQPLVAVLNLRFDGTYANVLEPGDTAVVHAATSKLYATLRASERFAVADSGSVAAAVAAAGGNPCDNACALAVARGLGAAWVVKGTVSKTSNLVWILTAVLLEAGSGRVLLQDGYELKGDAARMAPAGAHVVAQRVERAIAGHRPAVADP
jgi:TolB-like protein